MDSQSGRGSPQIRRSEELADDLHDLFDYDVCISDIFMESQSKQNGNAPSSNSQNRVTSETAPLGLGLDEEVKVVRKRKPVAKLDETR
jgi:replication fork protection complex subunit Csm3/Swi3